MDRRQNGAVDGRSLQKEVCDKYADTIESWLEEQKRLLSDGKRPESVKGLYKDLTTEHGYTGSYKSVVRYIRRRAQRPKLRPKRRVETKPGAQAQIDWGELRLNIGELGGPVVLYAFVMVLSFCRMWAVRWSLRTHQLSWLECHNQSFTFLGGIPATGRIDNLKTGVSNGAGPWGTVNPVYASYAGQLGFVVDKCLPARGDHKGKVERRILDVKVLQVKEDEYFPTLAALQAATDERILERSHKLMHTRSLKPYGG